MLPRARGRLSLARDFPRRGRKSCLPNLSHIGMPCRTHAPPARSVDIQSAAAGGVCASTHSRPCGTTGCRAACARARTRSRCRAVRPNSASWELTRSAAAARTGAHRPGSGKPQCSLALSVCKAAAPLSYPCLSLRAFGPAGAPPRGCGSSIGPGSGAELDSIGVLASVELAQMRGQGFALADGGRACVEESVASRRFPAAWGESLVGFCDRSELGIRGDGSSCPSNAASARAALACGWQRCVCSTTHWGWSSSSRLSTLAAGAALTTPQWSRKTA